MRAMLWMGGVVVTLAALIGAGHLVAESKEEQPPVPHTRIALLNLNYVINHYDKFKHFQQELKETMQPFQQKDAQLRKKMEKLRAEAEQFARDLNKGEANGKSIQQKKDALEGRARELQRAVEDNSIQARLLLNKKSAEEMKSLFRDVEQAVKRYAPAHHLDVVLQYNEPITPAEYFSTPNMHRKLDCGPLMPLTSTPGIDISKDISDLLNFDPPEQGEG